MGEYDFKRSKTLIVKPQDFEKEIKQITKEYVENLLKSNMHSKD